MIQYVSDGFYSANGTNIFLVTDGFLAGVDNSTVIIRVDRPNFDGRTPAPQFFELRVLSPEIVDITELQAARPNLQDSNLLIPDVVLTETEDLRPTGKGDLIHPELVRVALGDLLRPSNTSTELRPTLKRLHPEDTLQPSIQAAKLIPGIMRADIQRQQPVVIDSKEGVSPRIVSTKKD